MTIAWGFTPTLPEAPLLGYSITLRSCDHPQSFRDTIETYGNETELTLFGLHPGVNYQVTVSGWSLRGGGILSPEVMVTSMSALTPPAPANVSTTFSGGIVYVTWEVRSVVAICVDKDQCFKRWKLAILAATITATAHNKVCSLSLIVKRAM